MTNLQEDLTLALQRRAEAVRVENHLDFILDDANIVRFSGNNGRHNHDVRADGSVERHASDDGASRAGPSDGLGVPEEVGQGRSLRSRWLLSAAATVIVIGGIGALTTLDFQSARSDPADVPVDSGSPTGDRASEYRLTQALAANMVPFLEPAPAVPETVARARPFDWVSGITGFSLFGVRQGDQPASAVIVLETAIPWNVISEGLPTETIGETDAVIVRTPDETGLFINEGATVRAVFDAALRAGDEQAPADVSSAAREVGQLIAGQSLDAVAGSNRVVQITSVGAGSTVVRYGDDTAADTVLFRATIPSSMTDDDVPLAAELVSAMSLPNTPGGLSYERVSPTDLIVVVAADQDQADQALAAVQFDERPNTNQIDQEPRYDQAVARGEPSWGRWELATQSEDPTCWNAAATIWGPSNTSDQASSCNDAGATATIPQAFCLYMDDRVIGASLDSDAVFDFRSSSDPDGFEATVEQTNDTVTFQVRGVDGRLDRPQVEITIDGKPLVCSI